MEKYLITGIGGFVAQHFLDYLESLGEKAQILGIDLNPYTPKKEYNHLTIASKAIDLLDSDAVERSVIEFNPQYILHLASFSSVAFSWKNPTLSFKNNVNIFLNLMEVVRRYELQSRILSIGSSEEYGNVNQENIPLKETLRLDPVSPYAVARVSQEMLSKLYADSLGTNVIMTRSFNHIGPGQTENFVIPSFVKQIVEAKLRGESRLEMQVGNLEIIRDFLDVRDVVRAYYALLHKGRVGSVYNVCGGRPVRLFDILKLIGEMVGVEVLPSICQAFIRPNDNMVIVGDNSKIKEELGWNVTYELKDSIKDIIDYWTRTLSENNQ